MYTPIEAVAEWRNTAFFMNMSQHTFDFTPLHLAIVPASLTSPSTVRMGLVGNEFERGLSFEGWDFLAYYGALS